MKKLGGISFMCLERNKAEEQYGSVCVLKGQLNVCIAANSLTTKSTFERQGLAFPLTMRQEAVKQERNEDTRA
jgi:hypothetical protein